MLKTFSQRIADQGESVSLLKCERIGILVVHRNLYRRPGTQFLIGWLFALLPIRSCGSLSAGLQKSTLALGNRLDVEGGLRGSNGQFLKKHATLGVEQLKRETVETLPEVTITPVPDAERTDRLLRAKIELPPRILSVLNGMGLPLIIVGWTLVAVDGTACLAAVRCTDLGGFASKSDILAVTEDFDLSQCQGAFFTGKDHANILSFRSAFVFRVRGLRVRSVNG